MVYMYASKREYFAKFVNEFDMNFGICITAYKSGKIIAVVILERQGEAMNEFEEEEEYENNKSEGFDEIKPETNGNKKSKLDEFRESESEGFDEIKPETEKNKKEENKKSKLGEQEKVKKEVHKETKIKNEEKESENQEDKNISLIQKRQMSILTMLNDLRVKKISSKIVFDKRESYALYKLLEVQKRYIDNDLKTIIQQYDNGHCYLSKNNKINFENLRKSISETFERDEAAIKALTSFKNIALGYYEDINSSYSIIILCNKITKKKSNEKNNNKSKHEVNTKKNE